MSAPTPFHKLQQLVLAGWLLLLLAAAGSNGAPAPKRRLPLRAGLHIVMLNQPANTVQLAGAKVKVKSRVAWAAGLTSTRSPQAIQAQVKSVATKILGTTDTITQVYSTVLEGFAAELTSQQVAALRKAGLGVVPDGIMTAQAVSPSKSVTSMSVNTASFLGLDAPNGLWNQLGGPSSAGDDMIIAAIDSGYTPELPDFRDTADPPYGPPPPSWKGPCQGGLCNNKVIGCRYYTSGFGGDDSIKAQWPSESISCRPGGYPVSHGDAVLSSAGGNQIPFSLGGAGTTSMSGAAPRARLAMYKALWGPTNDGAVSDIIAAIDQAVSDGVDAIILPGTAPASYSNSFYSPYMMALKNAAAAGIILSGPAGNTDIPVDEGEDAMAAAAVASTDNTIAGNIAPWMITSGATTNSRETIGIVRTPEQEYQGRLAAEIFDPLPVDFPLVLGDSVCLPDVPVDDCRLCSANTLDPEKAAGKVVICDAGGPERLTKSDEVKRAGGAAMVLLNTPDTPDQLVSVYDVVNTIQLAAADRDSLRAYAATEGAKATFDIFFTRVEGPKLWDRSARGPIQPQIPDVIKPDVAAPGANLIVSQPNSYRVMSGTSLAAATTAGVAVLLKQKSPTSSPMAIKSALTTSAYQTMTNAVGEPTDTSIGSPFAIGGGALSPNTAADPGLVFDAGAVDFQRFQCSQLPTNQWPLLGCGACVTNPRLCDPLNLNLPSIAALNVAGTTTFKRTITAAQSAGDASFRVEAKPPTGFSMTVVPDAFTLSPGQTQVLDITITKLEDGLPNGQFSSDGTVVISGGPTEGGDPYPPIRLPVAARSRILRSPRTMDVTTRTTGFFVEPSFSGAIDTLAVGFDPSRVATGKVSQDPTKVFNFADPASTPGVGVFNLNINPSRKATIIRIALFNEDFSAAGVTGPLDLDMYVYNSRTNKLIASSALYFSSDEEVVITDATYLTVYVHGYIVPPGESVPVKLYYWVLRQPAPGSQNSVSKPAANFPAVAAPGQAVQVSLTVNSRLLSTNVIPYKQRYWGMILYGRGASIGFDELPLDEATFLTINN